MRVAEKIMYGLCQYSLLIIIGNFLIHLTVYHRDIFSVIEYNSIKYYGFTAGIFLFFSVIFRRSFLFWETLGHEMTHAVFGALSLNKIVSLIASERGGSVHYSGNGNLLVALAPYTIPLAALICGSLSLVLFYPVSIVFKHVTVIFFVGHFIALSHQFGEHQSDLHLYNYYYSTVFIVMINIIHIVLFIFYLNGSTKLFFTLFITITNKWGHTWITLIS